jgi:hypothetical protein
VSDSDDHDGRKPFIDRTHLDFILETRILPAQIIAREFDGGMLRLAICVGMAILAGCAPGLSGVVVSDDPAYISPGEGWFFAGASRNEVYWMHRAGISRRGNFARMTSITNLTGGDVAAGLSGARSWRGVQEFDCSRRRERIVSAELFRTIGAQGVPFQTVSTDAVPMWRRTPGSGSDAISAQIACGG